MSVLFLTIGNRDVQYVFERDNQKTRFPKDFFDNDKRRRNIDSSSLEYIPLVDIKKELTNLKNEEKDAMNPIGIIFPMLEKTRKFLEHQQIDQIFLISTDRKNIDNVLFEPVIDLCLEKEWLQAGTIVDDILFHSQKDFTSNYADIIENKINRLFLNVSVTQVKIDVSRDKIELVKKKEFHKYESEDELIALLLNFDFNDTNVMYPSIYNHFIKHIESIGEDSIYLSVSGGMPIMQKTLENVIRMTFLNNRIKIIVVPEKDSFSVNKINYSKAPFNKPGLVDYHKLLELRNQVIDKLNLLNFSGALDLSRYIKTKYNIANSTVITKLEETMSEIDHPKNDREFIPFYLRIISSIYSKDYINLSIYIKALQEQTQRHVINTCSGIEFIDKTSKNNQSTDIIILDNKEYKAADFDFWSEHENIWKQFSSAVLYNDIFLSKYNYRYYDFNNSFNGIKKIRNNFIHKGFAFINDTQLPHFYNFLNLNEETIVKMNKKVNRNQFDDDLLAFEQDYTGEGSTLNKIARLWYNELPEFTFRNVANRIIKMILETELQ
ncbi:MAG: hypothetical protein PHR06_13905 [Candidatus Cloacimonetes bacterium]|nr:hypothetical protein [Candidatus Cloacimonadota bacterium]